MWTIFVAVFCWTVDDEVNSTLKAVPYPISAFQSFIYGGQVAVSNNGIRGEIFVYNSSKAKCGIISFYDDPTKIPVDTMDNAGLITMHLPFSGWIDVQQLLRSDKLAITFNKPTAALIPTGAP